MSFGNQIWSRQDVLPVPMSLGVLVERCEHDGKDDINVVADQVAEILIIPEIESPLGNLEVGTCD